jgi:adenine C2-methylase RlmN of 23S rRNA A2503 and tRNA A37
MDVVTTSNRRHDPRRVTLGYCLLDDLVDADSHVSLLIHSASVLPHPKRPD